MAKKVAVVAAGEGTSKFAIANDVLALTEGGDIKSIESFFQYQVEHATKDSRKAAAALAGLKIKHDEAIDDINDEIEDCISEVKDAYRNVALSDTVSNSAIKEHSYTYWAGIDKAENRLAQLKQRLEEQKVDYKDSVDLLQTRIAKNTARIKSISA